MKDIRHTLDIHGERTYHLTDLRRAVSNDPTLCVNPQGSGWTIGRFNAAAGYWNENPCHPQMNERAALVAALRLPGH